MNFPWRQIPNAITVLRLLLIGPTVFYLTREAYWEALWLFLVAGLSDGLDGFLARACHWNSRFGEITDPLADKALIVAVYIVLTLNGLLPLWLLILIFARDLIIVAGALIYHIVIGAYVMQPTLWGKLNTLVQTGYAFLLIVNQAGLAMPAWSVTSGLWVVTGSCCLSGGQYIAVWGRKFFTALHEKRG